MIKGGGLKAGGDPPDCRLMHRYRQKNVGDTILYLEGDESSLADLTNSSPCFPQTGLSIEYPSLTFVHNDPTILPTGLNLPGSMLPLSSSISLRMWIYLTDARKRVVVTVDVFGSLMSTNSSNLKSGQLWCSAILEERTSHSILNALSFTRGALT